MGNCQTAETAAVVIHHPSGRVQRTSGSSTAGQLMAANAGHYVGVIFTAQSNSTGTDDDSKKAIRYVKLLRPGEMLLVGRAYVLVSFEDVLTEFAGKKRVRLSRLLARRKEGEEGGGNRRSSVDSSETVEEQQQREALDHDVRSTLEGFWGGLTMRRGQWRPTLQTIAETGS